MRAGITLILIAVALQALGPVSARSQDVPLAEQMQALETLFKVGLPETRGGKWVKAQLQDGNGGGILLPGDEAAGYTGNAWLVREEKNGTAELIILAAGWGFLTQRRKGAEDAELRSPGGPENVHLLGAPVEQRTFPPFLCALCASAFSIPSPHCGSWITPGASGRDVPVVQIQPADLDADLKKLATALRPGGGIADDGCRWRIRRKPRHRAAR